MVRSIQYVGATRQTIWGWPAVLNFFLGGMGSLFYAGSFFLEGSQTSLLPENHINFWRLLGPGLTALGFLSLVTEAGKPSRAVFILHHLHRSWMSREALAGGVFIACAAGFAILPAPALKWMAVMAAVLMSVCQAMMFYDCMGVTLWRAVLVPIQCLSGNLAAATALLLAVWPLAAPIPLWLVALLMAILLLDWGAWHLLLQYRQTRADYHARIPLTQTASLTLIFGIGHLVPLLLLISIAVLGSIGNGQGCMLKILSMVIAILVLSGGLGQKAGIVLGGNSLRPMRRSAPHDWQGGAGLG